MEEILKQILSEIKGLKEDVSGLKEDVIGLKEGQGRIEIKVDNLETRIDSLSSELRSNFKYTNDKLDEQRKVFDVVSSEIKGVKIDIEYLSSKTGRHDTELNQIITSLRG